MSVPRDDIGSSVSQGPFSLISQQNQQLVAALNVAAQIMGEQSINEIAESVLELPPEERFTDSIVPFAKLYGVEGPDDVEGSKLEKLQNAIPNEDQATRQLFNLVNSSVTNTQDDVLDAVVYSRESSREYLTFIVFLGEFREAFEVIEKRRLQEISDEMDNVAISRLIVLLCYLIQIATHERTEFDEEFLRDIVRSDYYGKLVSGHEPDEKPDNLTLDQIKRRIYVTGAIKLYERKDISVSRGAELAGMHGEKFRKVLESEEVEVRYDAPSEDEFESDPVL